MFRSSGPHGFGLQKSSRDKVDRDHEAVGL